MRIVASMGHGEYPLPDTAGVTVADVSQPFEHGDEWDHIVKIDGEPNAILCGLALLLMDLSFSPGGDDGTYDYWPSGMRFARSIIDAIGPQYPYNDRELLHGDPAKASNGLLAIWQAVARHIILDTDELGYDRSDSAYELFDRIGWYEEAKKYKP